MRPGACLLVLIGLIVPVNAQQAIEQPFRMTSAVTTVTLKNGTAIQVEAGELEVPESRRRTSSRRLTIPYYRVRAEGDITAAPIFLLHGGPGSSWLNQFGEDNMAREVAFYRSLADVVVFDQRGGGRARPEMTCPDETTLPADQPVTTDAMRTVLRTLAIACRDRWLREGVDLAAYNTVENAADVNDLRLALGYGKVTLIGGSYGSHLGLQFMRQYPDAVDRAVFYGIEGPDHTWDSPSASLATLERIARVAEQSPVFAGRVPEGGFLMALGRVISRLEGAPQDVTVDVSGTLKRVRVTADLVRQLSRRNADRRNPANAWPEMILALDKGDFSMPARAAAGLGPLNLPDPVHFSMDCASGVSEARRQKIASDPARAILGNLNLEYEVVCDLWPAETLDATFRTNLRSSIPTLLVHGTWDTSTPIDNAREVAAALTNAQLVEVVGGNHGALYNLYARWAPMYPKMREFLTGHAVEFPKTVDDMAAVSYQTVGQR